MLLAPVGVLHEKLAGFPQHHVVRIERRPDGTAAVAGRGLDVDLFERRLAQDFAVGDTIQGNPTGHAQPRQTRRLVGVLRQVQHRLFDHRLNTRRHIGVILILLRQLPIVARFLAEIHRITAGGREKVRLRLARGAKELDELAIKVWSAE